MKVGKLFPSKYLKATVDLEEGETKTVTISKAKVETFDDEEKLVLYFEEFDKGLVMNKTNAQMVVQIADSDDTDNWSGVRVTLYQKETSMGTGFGIRAPKPGSGPSKPSAPSTSANDLNTVKIEAWKALKAKYPTVTDDNELKRILAGHVDEFYSGQTPATIGVKQWRELIDMGFDADRLAMAGKADSEDVPF
jgi:hypothetical protein